MALTDVQRRALRMLDFEGSYARARQSSPNFYHDRHQPGNLYIDVRTAKVLVERGFAEVRFGRLFLTEKGRDYRKEIGR